MADPQRVYDDDQSEEPVDKPDLRTLEGGGETSEPKKGHIRAVGDQAGEPDGSDISGDSLKEAEDKASTAGDSGFYKPSTDEQDSLPYQLGGEDGLFKDIGKSKGWFKTPKGKISRRGRMAIGGGVGLLGLLTFGFAFFSFLNIFKLDHILQNIDAKTFSRYNAQFTGRSNAYVKAYIRVRMMEFNSSSPGDANGNLFFRANTVQNGAFKDWYATMRTSSFEKDLLDKDGIQFSSAVVPNGRGGYKLRPAKIILNDEPLDFNPSPDLYAKIDKINTPGGLSEFVNSLGTDSDKFVTTQIFNSDKEARRAIKDEVNKNTHFWNSVKRRRLRKNIQNMIGVRDWTFFETSTAKYREKKANIQQKILSKLFPNDNTLASFLQCIFVGTKCNTNNDPENQVAREENLAKDLNTDTEQTTDKNGKPVTTPVSLDGDKLAADGEQAVKDVSTEDLGKSGEGKNLSQRVVNKIVSKFIGEEVGDTATSAVGNAAAWWKLARRLTKFNNMVHSHAISKIIQKAKLSQYIALATMYTVARDQIKTGQVNPSEVGALMGTLNNFNDSEGWQKIQNTPGGLASAETLSSSDSLTKQQYCSGGHIKTNIEYAWFCDDQKPNSGGNATTLEAAYNNSIGYIISPIASVVNGINSIPIVGSIINSFSSFADKIIGSITSVTLEPLLKATGITDDLGKLMTFVMGRVLNFLGAAPVFTGSQPGAANFLIAGSAGIAENSTRSAGGVQSTPTTLENSNALAAQYSKEQIGNQSVFERYASINNPDSLIARSLFSIANMNVSSVIGSVANVFSSVPTFFSNIFSGRIFAASSATSASSTAQWAGVSTYDIPQQCMDLDPLDPNYLTHAVGVEPSEPMASKATTVLNSIRKSLTSTNIRDEGAFWKLVYDKIGTNSRAEDIAGAIYNCALLDQQVEGGLGYLYKYTDDGASLTSSSTPSSNTNPQPTSSNLYMVGDSLTYGLETAGLDSQLAQKGWQPVTRGLVSRNISGGVNPDGLTQVELDQSAVSQSGVVIVELGTNEFGASDSTFNADLKKMLDKIRSINKSAQIYWVNYVGSGSFASPLTQKTKLLQDFASSNGIKVIDWASIGGQYPLSGGVHPDGNYDKLLNLILNDVGTAPQTNSSGG